VFDNEILGKWLSKTGVFNCVRIIQRVVYLLHIQIYWCKANVNYYNITLFKLQTDYLHLIPIKNPHVFRRLIRYITSDYSCYPTLTCAWQFCNIFSVIHIYITDFSLWVRHLLLRAKNRKMYLKYYPFS
jgi:hypothetical protein